jgi:hypothetical protein
LSSSGVQIDEHAWPQAALMALAFEILLSRDDDSGIGPFLGGAHRITSYEIRDYEKFRFNSEERKLRRSQKVKGI